MSKSMSDVNSDNEIEITTNDENGDMCLLAVSVPLFKDDKTNNEFCTFYDDRTLPNDCPPGMQLVAMNEVYVETTHSEVEETIGFVLQDEEDSNSHYFYASEDVEEQTIQVNDNHYVPESTQVCAYNLMNETCQYQGEVQQLDVDECNVRFYEESGEHLESMDGEYTLENGDIHYPVSNVYVLREQHEEDTVEQQDPCCDNVLQEYGYAFVDEADVTVQNEECEEDDRVDVETLGEVVTALKCVSCHFTTLDKTLLVQHHSQAHCCGSNANVDSVDKKELEQVVYICGQCSMELPSIDACKQHMITEHNLSTSLTANQDKENEKTTSIQSVVDQSLHQYWLHHGTAKNIKARLCSDRKIRCTAGKCVYRFSTYDKMEKHKACHSPAESLKPFSCSDCDNQFAKWPQCSLHLHKHHDVSLDIITCPLCASHFTHSVRMMATHLQRHAEKEGNVGGELNLRWYSKKTCQICHKTYGNSKFLNRHIKYVHHKLRPFKCSVCGHSSRSKFMLQMHMRQHTGEKPYQCEYCPYRTGDHNTLHRHQKTHTKEHPYLCSLCPYSCIQSSALRAHIKSRHRETLDTTQDNNNQKAPS